MYMIIKHEYQIRNDERMDHLHIDKIARGGISM